MSVEIPEPVSLQFQRLPLPMRMRLAADVMSEVISRHRSEHPMAGFSVNEPISPMSMRFLADEWQDADARVALRKEPGV